MALAGSIVSNSSNRPHQSLARRLLFPNHTGDLPPLLASQNAPPELQAELYDFIALALRAYINPWWTKITRYDKEFLPQTARVLTSVVRALEARTLALDLPALFFQDVPAILTQHYRDYRNAASKVSSSYATGGAASLPQLFHYLQPHIALSAGGKIDLEYYRQIVDHMLKAVTQPWFIQKAILDLLGDEEDHLFKSPSPPAQPPNNSFSFHTIIIVLLSALQSFSSTCLALIHAYKQAISTIKLVNQSPMHTPRSASPQPETQRTTTYCQAEHSTSSSQTRHSCIPSKAPSTSPAPSSAEDYASQPLLFLSEMFLTSERLAATTVMTFFAMISASITPFLDKLLPHILYSMLSPGFILNLVRLNKRTMFPNGYPGPPPIDPTPEEQVVLRRRLVEWRGTGGLSHLLPLLFGADPTQTLNTAIDPLTCQPCNVHLIVILIDRILVGLFPELVGENTATTTTNPIISSNGNSASNDSDAGNVGLGDNANANLKFNNSNFKSNTSAAGERGRGGGVDTTSAMNRSDGSPASTPADVTATVVLCSGGGGGADS
ncbi:PXA domain protein 1 [Leucoagaricus sp. SymC.cos]|nr:PXA domain protein 1 [Leucoagaricus sp. SymC.cos]